MSFPWEFIAGRERLEDLLTGKGLDDVEHAVVLEVRGGDREVRDAREAGERVGQAAGDLGDGR